MEFHFLKKINYQNNLIKLKLNKYHPGVLMSKKDYRLESDSMGQMRVPKNALYAAQTARAIKNFPKIGRAHV